jgi:hypothetical protein
VRRGASWTAASHRQLTVAAVARPVRGSVGALGVLAAARSWWLLAQTTSAQRSAQPLSRGRALSPWSTRPAGTPRRRSPVSSLRCPPIRSRASGIWLSGRPVSGHLGSSSRGSGDRSAAVHPSGAQPSAVQLSAVHPCGVQPSGVRPRRSGRVRLLPCSGVALGPGRGGRATVTTGTGEDPVAAGRRRLDDGRGGRDAGDAAEVALVRGRWLAGPGRRVGCGPRRPRLPAERPGRPGRRSERPSRAAARWAREQAAARGGCIRRVAAVLGWVRDHGGWSSPSLTPGWAAPEGPGRCRRGWGVRPQRGPSRQRARPARCWQRCELGRWVVGLPGLEPGTSSLSAKCMEPLC